MIQEKLDLSGFVPCFVFVPTLKIIQRLQSLSCSWVDDFIFKSLTENMKKSAYRRFLYEDFTLGLSVPIIILNLIEIIYLATKIMRKRKSSSTQLILSLACSDLLLGMNMLTLKVMHRYTTTEPLASNNTALEVYSFMR